MKKIKVEDMTCMHCFQTIHKGLVKVGIKSEIDLKNKIVTVKATELDKAVATIKDLGYTPQV